MTAVFTLSVRHAKHCTTLARIRARLNFELLNRRPHYRM